MTKNFFLSACVVVGVFVFSLVAIVLLRSSAYTFDKPYLENLYYQSQWRVPFSPREMSDDQLYQVAGYQLAAGESINAINPEVPPFVKYLYGYTTQLTGNPLFVSMFFYIFSLLALLFVLRTQSFSWQKSTALFLLFASHPLLLSQVGVAMLDLPQMFFLTVFIYFFTRYHATEKILFLIVSAVCMGLFSAVKVPVFTPVVVCVVAAYLLSSTRYSRLNSFVAFGVFSALVGSVYVLSFLPYIVLHGGSISDVVANQKWMLGFYRDSDLMPLFFMPLIAVCTSYFRLSFSEHWKHMNEWTPLLFLATGVSLRQLRWSRGAIGAFVRNKHMEFLLLCLLLCFCVTPFYPRYLLLLLPMAVIILGRYVRTHVLWLLLVVSLPFSVAIVFPQPAMLHESGVRVTNYSFEDAARLFEFASDDDYKNYRDVVRPLINNEAIIALNIIATSERLTAPWQTRVAIPAKLQIESAFGMYEHQTEVAAIRRAGEWKVLWDWDYIDGAFDPTTQVFAVTVDQVAVTESTAALKLSDGTILSQYAYAPAFYFDTSNEMSIALLEELKAILDVAPAEIQHRIAFAAEDEVFLGHVAIAPFDLEAYQRASTADGITVRTGVTRVYNPGITAPTIKVRDTIVQKIKALETRHQQRLLMSGGALNIAEITGGRRVLVEQDQNLSDVILETTPAFLKGQELVVDW